MSEDKEIVESQAELAAKKKKLEATQPIIPPNPQVPWFMSSLVRDKTKIEPKVLAPEKGEDLVLAEGSQTEFWKFLKKFINSRRNLFEELLKIKAAASPYDMQEVGFRYLVYAQVDDVMSEIINRVENFAQFAKDIKKPEGDEDEQNK